LAPLLVGAAGPAIARRLDSCPVAAWTTRQADLATIPSLIRFGPR
jgi:hypothetical protein